jgi:hypothetical protein
MFIRKGNATFYVEYVFCQLLESHMRVLGEPVEQRSRQSIIARA